HLGIGVVQVAPDAHVGRTGGHAVGGRLVAASHAVAALVDDARGVVERACAVGARRHAVAAPDAAGRVHVHATVHVLPRGLGGAHLSAGGVVALHALRGDRFGAQVGVLAR